MTTMMMEPNTGSVDTLEGWRQDWLDAASRNTLAEEGWEPSWDDHIDAGRLIEVIENIEGDLGYDDRYGEWRPVEIPAYS